MRIVRHLWLLFVLSGCQVYALQDLRNTQPQGTPFQQALAREYLAFATQEEMRYNWSNSWHFADKGMVAAYGNDVGPENVMDWDVPAEQRLMLDEARDRLLTALKPEVVEAQPLLAARAYGQFDCWVARTQDAWQKDPIETCRQGFEETLKELETVQKPKEKKAVGGVDTTSYIVFFDWNRATLNSAGRKIVAEVAESLAQETDYEIVLNGHTDTTGLERFNLKLSKKRAEAVARALEQAGIAPEVIKIFAFGESDLRVPTADGVSESQNRRVEIFIQ